MRYHHYHHHYHRLCSSVLLVVVFLSHLSKCDDRTQEETSLEEQKRASLTDLIGGGGGAGEGGVGKAGEDEPRYDLVLALIEKYLKEKSSRKLKDSTIKNSASGSISQDCSKLTELNAAEEGSINYPTDGTYQNGVECKWRIQVPADKVVELTVRWLSIEATERCQWDRLDVFDGDPSADGGSGSLATLCGFISPKETFRSTGNVVVVRFTSDASIGYGGFQIDYRPAAPPVPEAMTRDEDKSSKVILKGTSTAVKSSYPECNGVKEMKESSGTIKFPLAGDYDNNLACKWRIVAPPGRVIQIHVTSIDIEAPEDCHSCCWFDWLSLYDARTENATSLMAKLCGTTAPLVPYTTTSNVALVVFKSNAKNGDEGFQLNYQVVQKDKAKGLDVCSGQVTELKAPSGVLESPGYKEGKFPESARCRWRLVAARNQAIKVTFKTMNIENDIACVYDSLSLYDGYNRSAPLLGRFCGHKLPPDVSSSGSTMMIVFESDSSMSDGGFSLAWSFEDKSERTHKGSPGCEGQTAVLRQNEGTIASPNYGQGNEYPNAAKCSWNIVVDGNMRAFLRFEKFSLEPPLFDTECYDSVAIYDGSSDKDPLLGSYCGEYTPNDVLSSSNQLFISFKSDKSTGAPGFLARFSAKNISGNAFGVECGVPDVMPKVYSRIVGGVEATPHSWPWQVSIKYSGHNWEHWCGGSVLSPRWVITAAHCVDGFGPAANFRVVFGEHNQLVNEGTERQMDVAEIIMHEKYDSDTNDNDIALFRLPEELEFNRYIKPICLPKEDVEANVLCITSGWGDTKTTGNESLLNQVYVPVISRIQCNQPNWYGGQLTDNMLCAGYPEGRKDSCQGDSGGPMVCLSEGRWRLNGLTSWGYDCAISRHPGVYTRVPRYLGWIQAKTGVTA